METVSILEKDIIGTIGKEKYLSKITWRNGTITMDEPKNIGGQDAGADPYTMLLAALAGCTLSTLRMYIDRKDWDIQFITVQLNLSQNTKKGFMTSIRREISFSNDITAEQKDRLLVVAAKCPVSKILENKIIIHTTI